MKAWSNAAPWTAQRLSFSMNLKFNTVVSSVGKFLFGLTSSTLEGITFILKKSNPLLMCVKLALISHATFLYNGMSGEWIKIFFAELTLAHPHCSWSFLSLNLCPFREFCTAKEFMDFRSSSKVVIDTFPPNISFFFFLINGASDTWCDDNGIHKPGGRN